MDIKAAYLDWNHYEVHLIKRFSGTYRFFIVNRDTNNYQQVHLTIVIKTGPCLGTLLIAAFPVTTMAYILGKRYLS